MIYTNLSAADHFQSKVGAAQSLASLIRGTKMRLSQTMEAAGPEYSRAVKSGDPKAVAAVVAKYQPEVQSIIADAWGDLALTPEPTPPPHDQNDGTTPLDNTTHRDDHKRDVLGNKGSDPKDPDGTHTDATHRGDDPRSVLSGADGQDVRPSDTQPFDDPTNKLLPDSGSNPPVTTPQQPQVPQQPQLPLSMMNPGLGAPRGGNPSGGLGGSGLGGSGLGSVGRPPVSPSSFPTSTASAATPPSSAPPAFSSPVSQAASGFQSGLASGMGSSGAAPQSAFQHAAQPFVQQAMPMTADAAGAGGVGTPAASAANPAGAAAVGAPPVSQSGVAGGGAAVGGGAMMAPPMAAGGTAFPPAPYSAPGAGSVSGPSAPTAPAGSPSPAGVLSSPSAGAGPVFAGSAAAVGAAGASSAEVPNPDLVAAAADFGWFGEGVPAESSDFLGGGRCCGRRWARRRSSPTVSVAGTYLPASVRLPSTVRLAALDPVLPFGWANRWMGWQAPSAILVDHFETRNRNA